MSVACLGLGNFYIVFFIASSFKITCIFGVGNIHILIISAIVIDWRQVHVYVEIECILILYIVIVVIYRLFVFLNSINVDLHLASVIRSCSESLPAKSFHYK